MEGFRSEPASVPIAFAPAVTSGNRGAGGRALARIRIIPIRAKIVSAVAPDPAPVAFDLVQQRGPPRS